MKLRPIYLLVPPLLMMGGGWIAIEYGQTVETIERGAWWAHTGGDIFFPAACVLFGFALGRTIGRRERA